VRFTEGNRVVLFTTGAEALAAMLEAVEAARERVHLETYILRPDGVGRRFLRALEARARTGVAVRVLYDAVGSRGIGEPDLAPLRRAGGDVVAFNPLRRLFPRFAPRRRDHRKLLLVDGQVGFTGGLNLGEEYERGLGPGSRGWRDTHVRIEGPALRDLEAVFLESWFRADGPDLPWPSLLERTPPRSGDVRCAVLADGPAYRRRRVRELLIAALEGAERRARLESPYFIPGRRVLEALGRAADRGLEVELLFARETDHPLLHRAARALVPRLLARGVRVFEYATTMMHAKVALFDDSWVVIGSSNLDRQSFEHSYEVNLILEGGDMAQRVAESFERDLKEAERIDASTLAARGRLERLIDALAFALVRLVV
jgi:cardiolipin synthase